MLSAPIFAASSTPPGSPVTYRPGMPIDPPARAISWSALSTVAGCSAPASFAVTVCFESDAVYRAIHDLLAQNLLDLLRERGLLAQVDHFAAKALGLGQTLRNSYRRRYDGGA